MALGKITLKMICHCSNVTKGLLRTVRALHLETLLQELDAMYNLGCNWVARKQQKDHTCHDVVICVLHCAQRQLPAVIRLVQMLADHITLSKSGRWSSTIKLAVLFFTWMNRCVVEVACLPQQRLGVAGIVG